MNGLNMVKMREDNDSHIYYNLKLTNINDSSSPTDYEKLQKTDQSSMILSRQSDYQMAIQSFRLETVLPAFLFPIKEGFTDQATISAITNANPMVITITGPTLAGLGLVAGDLVKVVRSQGMTQINGISYYIRNITGPQSFTVSSTRGGTEIDSTNFGVYLASSGTLQSINNNVNLSEWGFCMTHLGVDYSDPVIYIPDKSGSGAFPTPKTPKANNGLQDNSTYYYFCYSYNSICEMLNTTLASLTLLVNTATPGTLSSAPYFMWENNKFSLVIPYDMITNNVSLFTDLDFYNQFQAFRMNYITEDSPIFKDYQFNFYENNGSFKYAPPGQAIPAPPASPNYLRFEQEYSALYNWNRIVSIVILSRYIKSRNEYYPKISNPNSLTAQGLSFGDNNTASLPIIASFDFLNEGSSPSWREPLNYQPFVYKWIDLTSDEPLSKIDGEVFFETVRGEFIPAIQTKGSQSNIRILFRKK